MPEVTIVYWRDIPAQVIAGKGRRAAKRVLAERFEQAIDRCAMAIGARDTDAYLAEWRRAAPYSVDGDQDAVVEAEASKIEAEYGAERLKALIANAGWD
ncbi:virulence factor [Actibacterium sp. XHP0104]|uniref:virulence factor n=1 Tax=Actibacterium sp. XHP0104 TaxID=2984335 RepID=UPI0021E73AAE|nr:virulence factor [Actibacterium sp. XHP0104]MCV2881177.1 virulence factor [Actibacterium sp. XHP0104]